MSGILRQGLARLGQPREVRAKVGHAVNVIAEVAAGDAASMGGVNVE